MKKEDAIIMRVMEIQDENRRNPPQPAPVAPIQTESEPPKDNAAAVPENTEVKTGETTLESPAQTQENRDVQRESAPGINIVVSSPTEPDQTSLIQPQLAPIS